jgi:hypothetical protein
MFVRNPNTPSGKPLLWKTAKSPAAVKRDSTDRAAANLAKHTKTSQVQSILGSGK